MCLMSSKEQSGERCVDEVGGKCYMLMLQHVMPSVITWWVMLGALEFIKWVLLMGLAK